MVARKDQNQIWRATLDHQVVLLYCIGRSKVPIGRSARFVGRQDAHTTGEVAIQVPGSAAANMLDQRVRSVLRQDHDIKHVRVDTIG